jgi:hypothetical protein
MHNTWMWKRLNFNFKSNTMIWLQRNTKCFQIWRQHGSYWTTSRYHFRWNWSKMIAKWVRHTVQEHTEEYVQRSWDWDESPQMHRKKYKKRPRHRFNWPKKMQDFVQHYEPTISREYKYLFMDEIVLYQFVCLSRSVLWQKISNNCLKTDKFPNTGYFCQDENDTKNDFSVVLSRTWSASYQEWV